MKKLSFIKKNAIEIAITVFALTFSFWLMLHTFSYSDGTMYIATKAWSDFASHIPLIRSFSFGDNVPPEYPLFPGEPIRYHFLFYAFVGFLEKIGIRIDYALNIPSVLSFALLILSIYLLAKALFNSKVVGIFSVVFFLFNGSFSFIEFFKMHPLSQNTVTDIITNTTFPSFGPYDGKIVSAFWNLNIYTNQRHLALPLSLLFSLVLFFVKAERENKSLSKFLTICFGVLLALLPFSHSSVFIMAFVVLGTFFISLKRQRKATLLILIIGILISLPRIIFLKETASFAPHLEFRYLIPGELSLRSFISYWFANLGIGSLLIPIGVILSDRLSKKIFAAFLFLFLIGHSLQFSPEIAANHKFFNAFLIVGNMFMASLLVKLWNAHFSTKPFAVSLFFLSTLSGIIDFFPTYNDRFLALADYPQSPNIQWVIKNTPKDAVFLNSSYLYDTASLAGRKIFLGWPYFPWSLGHDTSKRGTELTQLLSQNQKASACRLLKENSIDYVEIEKQATADPNFPPVSELFAKEFSLIYSNNSRTYLIYSVEKSCKS